MDGAALPSQQDQLEALALAVGEALLARNERLVTAESCTGGWVAMALTSISGSSNWFERGFVTYSNDAKTESLGVSRQTLRQQGAVSESVVREMVEGALTHSRAEWALAISGVAGPSGGSVEKPVGTVCFAWSHKGGPSTAETCHFPGDRQAVRARSVEHALRQLLTQLTGPPAP
jgi:nicotinamide-nucleotide amidase